MDFQQLVTPLPASGHWHLVKRWMRDLAHDKLPIPIRTMDSQDASSGNHDRALKSSDHSFLATGNQTDRPPDRVIGWDMGSRVDATNPDVD
jgi:hypothetical protein